MFYAMIGNQTDIKAKDMQQIQRQKESIDIWKTSKNSDLLCWMLEGLAVWGAGFAYKTNFVILFILSEKCWFLVVAQEQGKESSFLSNCFYLQQKISFKIKVICKNHIWKTDF